MKKTTNWIHSLFVEYKDEKYSLIEWSKHKYAKVDKRKEYTLYIQSFKNLWLKLENQSEINEIFHEMYNAEDKDILISVTLYVWGCI